MAIIIAILNGKGGSGKTTLSTNIATCMERRGYSVLIVDSDPQGSARNWHEAHPEGLAFPVLVGIDRATLHKDIPRVATSFDFVVIDGAAKLEEMTASAIRAADVVLIPVKHSGFDLWAAESLVSSIRTRHTVANGRPAAAFIVSGQRLGSRLAKQIDSSLGDFNLPVFKSRTTQRVAYEEAGGFGVSVLDLEGRDKAAQEIEAITTELLTFIADEQV